ncbi:MAG: prepilin-type N-terminal cleavage/methylation domain-containing protein [Candidatus Scalinduaceae bacterium]
MRIIKNDRGFTILEIIIALAITAISITAFIQLLGNSTMLRSKVNDYDERLDVAITKAEQTFLGLIGDINTQSGEKNYWQGRTLDNGVNWRVEEEKDKSAEGNNENVYFYTVFVDGIDISSVSIK